MFLGSIAIGPTRWVVALGWGLALCAVVGHLVAQAALQSRLNVAWRALGGEPQ